ncbi:MAG: cupin protein [Cyanobacteria bacterium RYN_339]|nr:cupin protein [Cyanobacteria bacterium RYN_339]
MAKTVQRSKKTQQVDVTIKPVDKMGYYTGEHAVPGIHFIYAGKELELTTLGLNVLQLEPNCDKYPEHDHKKNGEEELYILTEGSATLQAGDETFDVTPGVLVRVGAQVTRKFVAGEKGATIVALSNMPDE